MSRRQRRSRHARRHRTPAAARALAGGSGLAVAGTLLTGVAHASTTVTVKSLAGTAHRYAATTNYGASETLADAVAYVNANGGGTITLDSSLSGSIALQEPLVLKHPTTIEGVTPMSASQPNPVTIDGSLLTNQPIFTLESGATTLIQFLNLENSGSNVTKGGAVFADAGLTLDHVALEHDSAKSYGGAVYSYGGNSLTVNYSTLAHNTAADGGAVYLKGGGKLIVDTSTLYDNAATTGGGGAIAIEGTSGATPRLRLQDATLYQNTAHTRGGAIFFGSDGTSGSYLKAIADTIVGNTATEQTGGIVDYSTPLAAYDTILTEDRTTNSPTSAPDLCLINAGASAQLIGSLIGSTAQCAISPSLSHTITSETPELSPLANNGGWSETMLPEPGSPVIDQGVAISGAPYYVSSDQRGGGYDRTATLSGYATPSWGNGTDIGAVEIQTLSRLDPAVSGLSPNVGRPGETVTIKGNNLLNAGAVTFGGTPATVTSDTQQQLKVKVPTGSKKVTLRVTGADGHTVTAGPFTYRATTKPRRVHSTAERRDDQLISLSTGLIREPLPRSGGLAMDFSSTTITGSHTRHLRFRQVELFYDGGIKRKGHRARPNRTLRHARDHFSVPLSGLHPGTNTIRALVVYSERLGHPHGHHRTKRVTASVRLKLTVA